jgi:hypothetical protein
MPTFAKLASSHLVDALAKGRLRRRPTMKQIYRVHRFNIRMTKDQHKLENFLNNLEGEVVAIIPNVTLVPATFVDFLLIVEKLV